MTVPIIAASKIEIPSSLGANKIIPPISKHAGTKHIKTAGRPTFFRSLRSNDNPALIKIIIRAILLRSDEIFKIEASITSNTYGPSTIPVTIIPNKLGR